MIRSRFGLAALCLVALALPTAATGVELDERLDLDLAKAPAAAVFEAFASSLEARLTLDPAVDGLVTVTFTNLTIRTAMTAVCESIGCQWSLAEREDGRLLRVVPEAAEPATGTLDDVIELELLDAAARDVLASFAEILGVSLALDEGLDLAPVTVSVKSEPVRAALDAVCAAAGCGWRLEAERLVVEDG